MVAVWGYAFTHETVREWEARFAPLLSERLKAKRRGQAGKSWYTDETYVRINRRWHYLYRAIDRDGNLADTMLSPTRDLAAAKAFFRQAVETVGHKPERVTTDGHDSYPRAIRRTLGRKVQHRTNRYLNNRIEQDHRGVKQRYYPMRGVGSVAGAARFCTAFDEVRHYFRPTSTDQSAASLAQLRQTFRQRWAYLCAAWPVAQPLGPVLKSDRTVLTSI